MSARLETEHGLTLSDFDVLAQLYFAPERALRRVDLSRQGLPTAAGNTPLFPGPQRAGRGAEKRRDTHRRRTHPVRTDPGGGEIVHPDRSQPPGIQEVF